MGLSPFCSEYRGQRVKAFAIHPGIVGTDISRELANWPPNGDEILVQTPGLSAWTYVRLTSGSENCLSGRYVPATTDPDEHAKLKDVILEQDASKNQYSYPFDQYSIMLG